MALWGAPPVRAGPPGPALLAVLRPGRRGRRPRTRGSAPQKRGTGLNMQKARWMVLAAVLAVAAQAQQTAGTLKGKVTDSSGAVIPGAKVAVTASGVERTAATDQTGSYTVIGLAPATYSVRIAAAGFGLRLSGFRVR